LQFARMEQAELMLAIDALEEPAFYCVIRWVRFNAVKAHWAAADAAATSLVCTFCRCLQHASLLH
jgi:hypothetical protein